MLAKPTSLTLILAALLGFACTVAATYPGIVSYDSVAQWEQAISADYSDWHPPIMAWLWSWLSPQTLGPRALFVLQMALYWGAFLSVACALRERAGWVLACALLPFTLNFSFVIWKDVWMAIMFALSAASAIHALTATRRWPWLTLAALALIGALLFRANALFAAPPLVWLALRAGWPKRPVLALLAAAPLSVLALLIAQNSIHALTQPKPTYPSQFIMVDDLFWMSAERNLLPAYVGANPDQLKAGVQRCRATALYLCPELQFKRWITHDKGEYNQLRRKWREALLDDPRAYATRRWQTFALLMRSPSQAPYEIIQTYNYEPNPQALRFTPNLAGRAVLGYVRISAQALPELFKPYFWLLIGGLALVIAFKRRANGDLSWPIPLALAGSGVTYLLGYALASQAADFRYAYWSIWAILFAVVALTRRAR